MFSEKTSDIKLYFAMREQLGTVCVQIITTLNCQKASAVVLGFTQGIFDAESAETRLQFTDRYNKQ